MNVLLASKLSIVFVVVAPSCLTMPVNDEGGSIIDPLKTFIHLLTSLFLRQCKTKMKNPCRKVSEHKNLVDIINKIK